jgi:hypothetical protein
MSESSVDRCVRFLREIGLTVREKNGARGFFDGIEIIEGTLLIDPKCAVSDLLHEAGHLAIVPGRYRRLMNVDLEPGWIAMVKALRESRVGPESALHRAVLHCSDTEATAWAWAAGRRLGLSGTEIIGDGDYDGDEVAIRYLLGIGKYVGIEGLATAGFCSMVRSGPDPVFPRLAFWTQEA